MAAPGTGRALHIEQSIGGAAHLALPRDGRDSQPADAGLRQSPGQADDLLPAGIGDPAIAQGPPLPDIEGGHDAVGAMSLHQDPGEQGVADERTAKHDATGAGGQRLCCRVGITDAASHLAGHVHGGHDAGDDVGLHGPAFACGVKVHDVDAFGTVPGPTWATATGSTPYAVTTSSSPCDSLTTRPPSRSMARVRAPSPAADATVVAFYHATMLA